MRQPLVAAKTKYVSATGRSEDEVMIRLVKGGGSGPRGIQGTRTDILPGLNLAACQALLTWTCDRVGSV